MTKKVLISLDELKTVYVNSIGRHYIDGVPLEHWFNSQPPASQWVRVEDGLPGDAKSVFIALSEKYLGGSGVVSVFKIKKIGRYHKKEKKWSFLDYGPQGDINTVTHWMPIPPLGEENE